MKLERKTMIVAGVVAATLGVTALGLNAMTDSDAPASSQATSESSLDDLYERLEIDTRTRMANASPDSYYETIANKYDIPRSTMDSIFSIAPTICQQWAYGSEDNAKAAARNIVLAYPSDWRRALESGEIPGVELYTTREMIDTDSHAFVLDTVMDYCPYLGYK